MSGSIDASIPLRAGQGVTPIANPLTQYGDFVHLQSALNQNALFPGQQQLQQQQITHGDQTTQSNATNLALQTRNAVYSHLAPYMADPDPTLDKVTQALGTAHANGLNVTPALDELHATFPVNGTAADRRQWLANRVGSTLAPSEQIAAVTPQFGGFESTGKQLVPFSKAPVLGPNAGSVSTAGAGAPIPVGLSQAEESTPTPIGTTGKGAPIMGTRRQFIDAAMGSDRFPQALRNPANTAPGVVTGVGPGQQAALSEQGATSAKAFQDIADQGVQARTQGAVLGNMLGDAAQFTSGPTKINEFKATMTRYQPTLAAAFGISPDKVAANESFDKLAAQIQSAQGAGSDARLSVAGAANPSSHLSQAGVDQIIRQLQGNTDYLQARAKLAAAHPDQADRSGFETSVGAKLDPRAFQFERMTPQQKTTYYSSLSDADKQKVRSAYNFAAQNGLIGAANGN